MDVYILSLAKSHLAPTKLVPSLPKVYLSSQPTERGKTAVNSVNTVLIGKTKYCGILGKRCSSSFFPKSTEKVIDKGNHLLKGAVIRYKTFTCPL